MKRFVLFLSVSFLLSGCAQVFDGNLFTAIDTPPPLSATALASASVADIQAMADDPSFFDRLQDDPAALTAVQTALEDDFDSTAVSAAATPAAEAAVVDAAQMYILATAWGSDTGEVANTAVTNMLSLASGTPSGADVADAVTSLFDGQSTAEVTATLNHFLEIAAALAAMQDVSDSSGTIDEASFLPADTNDDLIFPSLVAGAVAALVSAQSPATAAGLAAAIAAGTVATSGGDLADLTSAVGAGSPPATTNPYAFMYNLVGTITP